MAMNLLEFRKLKYVILALALTCAPSSRAEVLVELFTSQGCSACVLVDDYLTELEQEEDDVVVLSYHVNYWDYLGWSDSFAKDDFTERQAGYQKKHQSKQLYTPQIVIGGAYSFAGDNFDAIDSTVELLGSKFALDFALENMRLHLSNPTEALKLDVWLVHVTPEETVSITEGENKGLNLTYRNIVRDFEHLGSWDGTSNFEAEIEYDKDHELVVILQEPNFGAVKWAKKIVSE